MPCNTIVTNTVDLGRVARDHPDLLLEAITSEFGKASKWAFGGTIRFFSDGRAVDLNMADGKAQSAMPTDALQKVVSRLNRAVSKAAVKLAARRFGWVVTPGADANHFQLVKR